MSKEAMKLALEALDKVGVMLTNGYNVLPGGEAHEDVLAAITALQEALAEQPAQQTIHCKHRRENNGVCPHHNLQCGWPKCNEPEQPAQQEPDRVKFERHWRKTRGEKKANRELPRHPLQPQTYIQDSANRHWVTWQAAVMSVAPPAQEIVCSTGLCHYRKPLTNMQRQVIRLRWQGRNWSLGDIIDAVEELHGIKENT